MNESKFPHTYEMMYNKSSYIKHNHQITVGFNGSYAATRYSVYGIFYPKGVDMNMLGGYTRPCVLLINELTKRCQLHDLTYLSKDYWYEKTFGRNAWQSLKNPDVQSTFLLATKVLDFFKGTNL